MSGIGLGGRAELVPDPGGASPASPVLPAPASQRLPRGLANLASAGLLFPTSSAAAVARSPRAGSHGSGRSVEAGEGASGGSGQNWGPCVCYHGRLGVAEPLEAMCCGREEPPPCWPGCGWTGISEL